MKYFTLKVIGYCKTSVLIPAIFITFLLACSLGDGSTTEEPELDYRQKVSNIISNESHLVFAVEVDDNRFELFSYELISGISSGISDNYSAKQGLRPAAICPDGNHIAYQADKNYDGIDELYSNLIDGSEEVLLSDSIASQNSVVIEQYNWQWIETPLNEKIIFRSNIDDDNIEEIQSINSDGSGLTLLSDDLPVRCVLSDCWKLSPAGNHVIFLVESINQTSQVSQNLYHVLADGTELTRLSTSLNENSRIDAWQWSPEGLTLAYVGQNIGSPKQLFTWVAEADLTTLINGNSLSLGVERFKWSPNSSYLAFTDDIVSADQVRLYRSLTDGAGLVQLTDHYDVPFATITDWQWSPDSSRVAYRADQTTQGISELFVVENDGKWHRTMNGVLLANTLIDDNWQWSPNSLSVSFLSEQETVKELDEFYVSRADGSVKNIINLALTEAASLLNSNQHWLADSTRVIYQITLDGEKVDSIYSVLPDGTSPQRLTTELTSEQSIIDWFAISPNNINLLYQTASNNNQLNTLKLAKIASAQQTDIATTGISSQAQWLSNGKILYVHQASADVSQQLLIVLADATEQIRVY